MVIDLSSISIQIHTEFQALCSIEMKPLLDVFIYWSIHSAVRYVLIIIDYGLYTIYFIYYIVDTINVYTTISHIVFNR